jgi:hypothetical protein
VKPTQRQTVRELQSLLYVVPGKVPLDVAVNASYESGKATVLADDRAVPDLLMAFRV